MPLSLAEQRILAAIPVGSENNPHQPEFPADAPKFPATPTYQIAVPGFSNVWLKDESYNLTGTHKDRMAWEIVVTYRAFLLAKERGQFTGELPHMSIISAGSAATAIQTQLAKYGLPNLKVLVDVHTAESTIAHLKKLGCDIYSTDLSKQAYGWREILALTNNNDGLDITSGEALDPNTRFYDWLSYEILNSNADYCFIPFGTGNLYENILNRAKNEVSTDKHDPRFTGDAVQVSHCNFMGATTSNPNTKAVKLYSPHLPFVHFDEQWMRLYRTAGYCGSKSDVYQVQEQYVDEAIALAESQGIQCEPSGIAGLALLLQMKKQLPTDAKMLIVNTGKVRAAE